jgi:hypothetical protein
MKKLLCVFVSLTLFSCNKEFVQPEIPEIEKKVLFLTANQEKSWKLTKLLVKLGDEPEIDLILGNNNDIEPMESCVKDNVFTFKKNQDFICSEGDSKCQNDDTSFVEEGSFTLTNDVKSISLNITRVGSNATYAWFNALNNLGDGSKYNILSLSNDVLILEKFITIEGAQNRYEFTFSKI